jgi:hypothetical protein
MNDEASNETTGTEEGSELLDRRLFLRSMGKWSAPAIAAVVSGGPGLHIQPRPTPAPGSITGAVAAGDGSIAVAMAAAVHGSIAVRRLYRTHLRGAGNQSVCWVPAMNSRVFSFILLPTSE